MQANTLVIITGVSGSGKSTALESFEDMGFFCVDNLPAPLIANFVDFLLNIPAGWAVEEGCAAGGSGRFALLADCRDESAFRDVSVAIEKVRSVGTNVSLLFVDCSDDVVIHRFRETRRPHPLLLANPSLQTVQQAMVRERQSLSPLREIASRVIDTTGYSPHELRRVIEGMFGHESKLQISLVSFGFKYGVPFDADLIIDVRFLPNPHFVAELKGHTGNEEQVRDFVLENDIGHEFLERYQALLKFLIPHYTAEGKRYLTVGIGCTGGRHRSVAVARELGEQLKRSGFANVVRHRDCERPG